MVGLGALRTLARTTTCNTYNSPQILTRSMELKSTGLDFPTSYGAPYTRRTKKSYWSRRNALIVLLLVAASHWLLSRVETGHTRSINPSSWLGSVQFDNYSLSINGQRVFLHSGEFHTFRLPVPGLWPDILQKAKAAGLNAISVYTHMGLINPSRGVIDFDGYRSLKPLFEAATNAGLFIVLRPGPYINAETSAGGIAHWVTMEVTGPLRTNSTDYHVAWQDYIKAIINEVLPYQVTRGGPIIAIQLDNEYSEDGYGHREYFQELKDLYRGSGVDIPLTYNDARPAFNFINGTGSADLYGLDSYPQRFDCSNPDQWAQVAESYRTYHLKANPTQPFYIPEFQAGSFDAWGPSAPGYAKCAKLTGPDFQSVFNKHLWAANAKMINYYMFYGGTSWGGLPYPGVYTSYDYGAPLSEARGITAKYTELKLQGLFLRSSPEFYKTDWVGDTNTGAVKATSEDIFGTALVNPDTSARFYIIRHKNSSSTTETTFGMEIETIQEILKIPQVASAIILNGRDSKVIVTDYAFGSSRILYSTASVLFAGRIDGRDVLYLHGRSTEEHELSMAFSGLPNKLMSSTASNLIMVRGNAGQTIVNFLPHIQGLVTVWDSDTQLVLFSDTETAGAFWAPSIASSSPSPFANFWQFGTNSSILVGGPYLVRDATITGRSLALRGDLKEGVRLVLIAPKFVSSITWNGEDIGYLNALDSSPSIKVITLPQNKNTLAGIKIPQLSGWKYANSLPEIQSGYDDSMWMAADHFMSRNPNPMLYGDGRVLYSCDYGFCENAVLWRGHFEGKQETRSVNLSINGGQAFAASVWLNDVFLGTSFGNSSNNHHIVEETDDRFVFPSDTVKIGGDNVITVIQDNMGLDQGEEHETKNPRGIRGFALDAGVFSEWKVQGKVGGYTDYPDKARGVLNEGGLFGEREGWHLPGYNTNTSNWVPRDLSEGLPGGAAGIGFFVTTFDLKIDRGLDVALSFTFNDHAEEQPYRALLFVNGWMMGKRIANIGPQFKFPVHEGILNYRGKNTVAVAIWAMSATKISPKLELTLDAVVDGGVGEVEANNPSWFDAARN